MIFGSLVRQRMELCETTLNFVCIRDVSWCCCYLGSFREGVVIAIVIVWEKERFQKFIHAFAVASFVPCRVKTQIQRTFLFPPMCFADLSSYTVS